MKKINDYLGDKKFWKQTARLAIPIAFQNLLISSFVLVDNVMVGQLGDVALSSVGMAGQWSWLLGMVIFGVCSGASVYVSQYWGVKDIKSIHKISGLSVVISLIISVFFLLFAFLMPELVISIFNRNPDVIKTGSSYLKIACFSYPGVALNTILCGILRSTENVKLPVITALFTTLFNAVLDYALIFGAFGLPKMGVPGAAVATCISAWSGPVILVVASYISKNIIAAPFKDLFGFDKKMIKAFFITALPVVLNETIWGAGTFVYNIIFANLGHENYAAVTILKTIENIAFVLFMGLCNACCVMLGKNIGSGDIKTGIRDSKRFSVLIPLSAVFIGILVITFRGNIIGLFNIGGGISKKTLETAMLITLIYAIELPIRNIPYAMIVGVFRSGGDTVSGVKFDLIPLWCIALPLTVITAFVLKLPFPLVFLGMYIFEDFIKAFLCIRHYLTYKWIKPVTKEGKESLKAFMEKIKQKI